MAHVGESIGNGAGERVVWRQTASSSNGAVVSMEVFVQPGAPGPPPHIHMHQEERFAVLGGKIAVTVAGDRRVLERGDEVVIPAGTAHTWKATGEEVLHAHVELRPALEFEKFQETLFWLQRNGRFNLKRISNVLQIATLFDHHLVESRTAKPPAFVQRLLLGTLAAIGRRAGYTPHPNDPR